MPIASAEWHLSENLKKICAVQVTVAFIDTEMNLNFFKVNSSVDL